MLEHVPVLKDEIIDYFQKTQRPVRRFLDATFGRGGHTRAILETFPFVEVVAYDHDLTAVEWANAHFAQEIAENRFKIFQREFSSFDSRLTTEEGGGLFDIILLDLGVSSPQLDNPERGFSFYNSGPLDMRMDQRIPLTAADIVNSWDELQLRELFLERGEIRRPNKVISAIIEFRQKKKFTTTRELASLIERCEGWFKKGHHPATRYFLALRLAVNRELENLEAAIPRLIDGLEDFGRLAIITFHSLEDRIAKYSFKGQTQNGVILTKKVVHPAWEEMKTNPRARSAKLRVFERRRSKHDAH